MKQDYAEDTSLFNYVKNAPAGIRPATEPESTSWQKAKNAETKNPKSLKRHDQQSSKTMLHFFHHDSWKNQRNTNII